MDKPQTQTRDEILMKKRIASKKRYQRLKNDETLWKERLEKRKISDRRKREEKRLLSQKKERRTRKRWRRIIIALRKKPETDNTSSESPQVADLDCIRKDGSDLPPSTCLHIDDSESEMYRITNGCVENTAAGGPSDIADSPSESPLRRLEDNELEELRSLRHQLINLEKINEKSRKTVNRLVPAATNGTVASDGTL